VGLPGKGKRVRVVREPETVPEPVREPVVEPVREPEPVKVGARGC
jgi:hypothetical protein